MRISAIKEDPGYLYNGWDVKIFVDGVEVKFAITADDELGFVDVYRTVNNQIVVEGDKPVVDRIHGKIAFETPPGWTRVT